MGPLFWAGTHLITFNNGIMYLALGHGGMLSSDGVTSVVELCNTMYK